MKEKERECESILQRTCQSLWHPATASTTEAAAAVAAVAAEAVVVVVVVVASANRGSKSRQSSCWVARTRTRRRAYVRA